ncbi:MAG TPA: hypothetical protein VM689_07120 [Aliidongia sp.]|nr:hypothetical protein [Aliidongia sp.]
MTYSTAVNELRFILDNPSVPPEVLASAARFVDRLDQCMVVVPEQPSTSTASDYAVRLEPSPLFSRYLDAARSGKWPLLLALEAETTPDRMTGWCD